MELQEVDSIAVSNSTMDAQASKLEFAINAWYASSEPRFIDLVGDYAGRELFLLEGDSLLRECFSDDRLDFLDGFQVLHAVFIVERFLENLIKRHCRFHIAFYDEHSLLCVPAGVSKKRQSRYLFARSVVIRHLQLHVPKSLGIEVHVFTSLESGAFEKYLTLSPVHFIMAHDGSPPATGNLRTKSISDSKAKALLRTYIWWFNTHNLNVALINRVEFRDTKVFTMILEGWNATRQRHKFQAIISSIWRSRLDNSDQETHGLTIDSSSTRGEGWLSKPNIQEILREGGNEVHESWFLTVYSISMMLSTNTNPMLCSVFLLHVLIIKHLSLCQRRLPLFKFEAELVQVSACGNDSESKSESGSHSNADSESDLERDIKKFIDTFAEIATGVLADEKWTDMMSMSNVKYDLADAVDGRLFRALLQAFLKGLVVTDLPSAVQSEWSLVSKTIFSMCGKNLSLDAIHGTCEGHELENETGEDVGEPTVMPFSNSAFDEHLACINVVADTALPARLASIKLYRETTHWHNRKPLVSKQSPQVKVTKWKNPLRMNQFYMAEMTAYAASLTGAKGKALKPETITIGVKQGKGASHTEDITSRKKGVKKADAGMSKAQQIIAQNMARKGGDDSDKAFKAWTTVMKDYDEISTNEERYLRAKSYLDAMDTVKSTYIEAEVNLYLLQTLLASWGEYCKTDKKAEGYHVVAIIWTLVRTTCLSKALTQEIYQILVKICNLLSINDVMGNFSAPEQDRKLSFRFKYPANLQNLQIGLAQVEFQLLHVGPYMDRVLDAKPDSRVSSFIPDGWQRKVLDELDANHSVFVVAPTSAGKTFISFYAMEQVLRADNDGVLVYVAPTKALVNQIAAEVQARFSKIFPQAGKSVWAIHTRDYRVNNSTGCQVLVTVPHILQIMLLAPTNAKSWAPRVRRIIFDEIHSIGQAEDGVVWEQLLLLAPCPIIALSATVGNPAEFSDWLAETQKASGTQLTMIQHTTRYSDLRKYLYEPPITFRFEGLGKSHDAGLGLDAVTGLTYFHPIASLVDKSRGMPDDLALEPRDCLLLWKAMEKYQNDKYEMPASLNPSKALPPCIKKADIFKWERDIKCVLVKWMKAGDRESPFEKVVLELSPPVSPSKHGVLSKTSDNEAPTANDSDEINADDLRETTLPLLYQLHKRQALPAILFNYDRSGCEDIANTLLDQLSATENNWKQGKEWQRKLDEWGKWKVLKEKKAAKKPPKASKKKRGEGEDDGEKISKADQTRDEASAETSSFDLFDPDEPQDDFSFADKKRCAKLELDIFIAQLRRKHIKENLIKLLQRGIGIHHSGMNRKYRQCVEMLFRKGFLRVVIATGTLSLGINMPCATVVFSGDSVFLTALNFRQASGRSGRRGFDLLGNVVFQGITTERVCRLLSSRLPDLIGHFPITTTLVLRLFTLLHNSNESPYAFKAINSLLSQPRLYLGGESFKEQVLHHLRFSIEYLRRQDLLGPGGEPINLTSCVSHLYFTENSSFAFHALLKDGYFKDLCADIDRKSDEVLRTMMLVLSHLFGRKVCKEVDDPATAEMIKRSPSIVYLPPLPEKAATLLRQHNAKTLSIFTSYVKTFAEQYAKGDDRQLPLTNILVGVEQPANTELEFSTKQNGRAPEVSFTAPQVLAIESGFAFLPILAAPRARSAFVALSGHGDDFDTIIDLCKSARSGIFLESSVIPYLELHPDESRTPLNAYLFDFFMHGSIQPLEIANGIRRSDVWFDLNDFSLVLATIVTSLAGYLGLGKGDVDDEILETMGFGDIAENDDDAEMAETSTTASTTSTSNFSTSTTNTSVASGRSKPKRVAEDWDAAEDAIVAQQLADAEQEIKAANFGTDDQEYKKLMNVYRAFKRLKVEFDTKFREIWA